jgi:pyruvate formate lyase activating enzyme
MTRPVVASAALHPAPPESYTVFMSGCNFKCLNCQNWTISQFPDNGFSQRGYIPPKELAEECVKQLKSIPAKMMGADRIFFSGGEATVHLPYIEKVVEEAKRMRPDTRVNFDTNGYMTEQSLERVLAFTTSITYDLKAFSGELHWALTGASAEPVLRNAEYIARHARNQLWEYRILVIPGINEDEIRPLAKFIAKIDPSLPVCFLAFRPNFVLERHSGASTDLMEKCVSIAQDCGLEKAYWSGHTGLPRANLDVVESEIKKRYRSESARLAASYAFCAGCQTHPRRCSTCTSNQECRVKRYVPVIVS